MDISLISTLCDWEDRNCRKIKVTLLSSTLIVLGKKSQGKGLTLSKLITKLITTHLKEGGVKELIGTIISSDVVKDSVVKPIKVKGFIHGHP